MNPIDLHISHFFSIVATQHHAVTSVLAQLSNSYFFRGQIVMLMLWWVWFYPGPDRVTRRQVLVSALLACVIALAIGRAMVATLPLRLRPSENPVFHFPVPPLSAPHHPESSFPSDHAILFVGLATGLFLASRRVGSLALAYIVPAILFPRLWLGFHFLSDLLAGALMGGGLVLLFYWSRIRSVVARPFLLLLDAKPHIFYAGLFFFSYQVAEMFDPMRAFVAYMHVHAALFIVAIGH
ncbi:MAG TPA: phosphatase PAP2 family protein [Terriglobales bacterium]|jgi:undecaprenyl-diphosphatase|nr:phosphatase PAP2 family protein [Terriglobales bacterium]